MRNTLRILWTGIAIAQLAAVGVQAAATYQLDNGSVSTALNASDGTETLDNWFANEFTGLAGSNLLTRVDYGLFLTAGTTADVVIYQGGALGFSRIFVEGGGVTVSSFLSAGLLDRLHIAVAPLLIGAGRPAIRLPPRVRLQDCLRLQHRVYRAGMDILFDCDLRAAAAGHACEDPSRDFRRVL